VIGPDVAFNGHCEPPARVGMPGRLEHPAAIVKRPGRRSADVAARLRTITSALPPARPVGEGPEIREPDPKPGECRRCDGRVSAAEGRVILFGRETVQGSDANVPFVLSIDVVGLPIRIAQSLSGRVCYGGTPSKDAFRFNKCSQLGWGVRSASHTITWA